MRVCHGSRRGGSTLWVRRSRSTPHTRETLWEQPRLGQGPEEGGDEPGGREAGALQEVGNLRGPGGLRATGLRLAQEQTQVAYTELLRTPSWRSSQNLPSSTTSLITGEPAEKHSLKGPW